MSATRDQVGEYESFTWTRDVPRGWQEELDRLFPRDDVFAWLKIEWWAGERFKVWHPGQFWQIEEQRVQRWVIYQMSLPGNIPDLVLPDLEGPHPRLRGHWEPRTREWVSDCNVSREQWELYRSTGCYAQPFWVIQGDQGGHKRRFTPLESRLLKANGHPGDPPFPGDLPYAELDNRVFDQLLRYDRLRRTNRNLALAKHRADYRQQGKQEAQQAFNAGMLDWLERQVVQPALEAATNAAGRVNVDEMQYRPGGDLEQMQERFLHQPA